MTLRIFELAKEMGAALEKQGLKLATAESCTGGGLSYFITSIPGSSNWFDCGFVTYSDAAKTEMLGVNSSTIKAYGAVSDNTAREMAEGALLKSKADIGLAITGIAGPTGGSPLKPVGTVWIALAKRNSQTLIEVHLFFGDRESIRLQAIEISLRKILAIVK